ncbi:MAG: hypothetical protein R2754_04655 [Microthrixaceae bacterium]
MRVLPEPARIGRAFDYLVPEDMPGPVAVGSRVRIGLAGRPVGGWVLECGVTPPAGVTPVPIRKISGFGPPGEVIELCRWAAHRWAGRLATFLGTASPERAVMALPDAVELPPPPAVPDVALSEAVEAALAHPVATLRLPPAADPVAAILAALRAGPGLVVVPEHADAARIGWALRRAGVPAVLYDRDWAAAAAGGSTVVGTRTAAFSPQGDLTVAVLIDEHDESLQEEGSPSWHAREVLVERCRRLGIPLLLVSPAPSQEAVALGPVVPLSRNAERAGWAPVEVIDLRAADPRVGLFPERIVAAARAADRPVFVLNRKGRSKLSICRNCSATASCQRCGAAVVRVGEDAFTCPRCRAGRPEVCLRCRGTAFANLRQGVTRVAEEAGALLGVPVAEASGPVGTRPRLPEQGPVVGTEAVLHRAGGADLVVFLDFDQELLAPRYRGAEQAMALLARGARLVGPRGGGGRVMVATREPDHPVVRAAVLADPARAVEVERARRQLLGYPPFGSVAEVAGQAAPAYVQRLEEVLSTSPPQDSDEVQLLAPEDGRWLLRAPNPQQLADLLARVERPPGRLRLRVDPMRL